MVWPSLGLQFSLSADVPNIFLLLGANEIVFIRYTEQNEMHANKMNCVNKKIKSNLFILFRACVKGIYF